MSLEAYTGNLSDLVITNPAPTDPKSQGDDHLRGIKKTLVDTFGATTGPIYGPSGVKFPDGSVQGSAAYSKAQSDGPAFSVALGANQGSAGVAYEKINLDSEFFDTANCFSGGRFTPNVAGYYQINFNVFGNSSALTSVGAELRKNNLQSVIALEVGQGANLVASGSATVYMNGSTDYLELWGYAAGGTEILFANGNTQMSGFLARMA